MLRIYHSNRLDVLEGIMEFIISRQPLSDALEPEVILVQSNGMAQWLQMALADQLGIAANIQFPLPARFIWQMFSRVLADVPAESAFTRENMHWKIMALLPQLLAEDAFAPLRHYLHDDADQRKLFQLCWRIADLYDQYLVYRPHWLTCWEAGKRVTALADSQNWQARLWQALVAYTAQQGLAKWHKANLYERFIHRLMQDEAPPGLPSRVFICGISALPSVYLQALQALGRHCQVHLLVTNPCRYYWGDIRDAAALSRLISRQRQRYYQREQQREPPSDPPLSLPAADLPLLKQTGSQAMDIPAMLAQHSADTGNPLLASWGKQGRDYMYLLAELTQCEEVDAFAEVDRDSLLHNLQADILYLQNPTDSAINNEKAIDPNANHQQSAEHISSQHKRLLSADDRSVTLHICHSAQREMEVLHDQLLAMLERDPALTPRDIIVMVPDIDSYYPFIQAVFGAASDDRYIPYAVSDRRARQIHPILQAVLSLLALPESRFSAEEVLQLLEVPALAGRFAIDEAGLGYLRQWIKESGIRWGLDDDNVRELALPVTGQHTWRFGLTRMLLGYAMDSHVGLWQSVLPYDETSGLIGALAGQLGELLDQLANWRKRLAAPRLAADWLPLCRQLLDDFFLADQQTSEIITLVEQQWQTIISAMLNAGYAQPVSVTLLRDELENQLDYERASQRFLAGSVNFCTLMPMRSIPFKVICLAGMNDGVYPRPLQPLGFDLMRQQPMPGDRSRADDDRYLLLEALISARQTLYISYIGRSIQDNHLCLPSVLVEELLDYIGQSHYLAGDEALTSDESAGRVREHISYLHSRTPFDASNFAPDAVQQSFAAQWLPAASGHGQAHLPFIQPLPAIACTELDIDTLQRFWRHPVRSFFQMRLRVSLRHDTDDAENSEPFSLDPLQRYQLNQQLLNALVERQDITPLYQHYRGSGLLPHAAFGELLWQHHVHEMRELAEKIQPQRSSDSRREIDLLIEGVHLTGWLPRVQEDGLLRWQPSFADARYGMSLWIEHLLCCASGQASHSRLYGKKSQWIFPSMPPDEARQRLQPLIHGYQQGLNRPLTLLPKSAGAWLTACYDAKSQQIDWQPGTQQAARNKLEESLRGGYAQNGESADVYYQRLWRDLTEDDYQQIIHAAERYLLPLWQHNQPEQ